MTSRLTAYVQQLNAGVALAVARGCTHRVFGEAARNLTMQALFG